MMKKLLITATLLFVSQYFYAQDFDKIASIKFTKIEDYKNAEPDVLKCAEFLFRTPTKPDTDNRILAKAFIINWMSGTSYTFRIDEDASDLTKGDHNLLAMYLAAMTKIALSKPNEDISDKRMFEEASILLAHYCADKKNKLKPSRKLKKIIKTLN